MPFLDDLMTKIRAQLPEIMGGYAQGAAQSRLAHTPMQVVPDDQWGQVRQQQGFPNAYGATKFNSFNQAQTYVPQREFLGTNAQGFNTGDLHAPGGTAGAIPRHEAIHAFLQPFENKLDTSKIAALIGPEGMKSLYGIGYNYSDAMSEVPARLTTQPETVGMTKEAGADAMRKYIELLRQQNPGAAARMSKYLGLDGPAPAASNRSINGSSLAETQPPNVTF